MTSDDGLTFGVLGPLEMCARGRPVPVGGPRQRTILAALVVQANRSVGIAELMEVVWGDQPPATGRRQVQNAVSELRKVMTRRVGADPIRTEPEAYRLSVSIEQVDLLRFDGLAADGRRLAAAGDPRGAVVLREAVSLWRGPALADVPGDGVRRYTDQLEETHLAALEDCFDQELAHGVEGQLVTELAELVRAHPLRERLVAAYMLALYRRGRHADALAAYRDLADRLADELGVDPGPQARRRYIEVLRENAALSPPALDDASRGSPRPAQVPAGGSLVGRVELVRELDALLTDSAPAAVVISAIAGTAGIGKTTLAVSWAHRVADRFPDGQLYVNLRGFDPSGSVVTPEVALRGFLDAFGVPGERIPVEVDAQAALYRSVLADKRVLVVLDNARDSEQVRPLLPGTAGSLVVVTSRNRLTSLIANDGAKPLTVDLLTADEARDLLAARVGHARVAAEPDAVAEIITSCARLPLALAIVAAQAAAHPGFPLAVFAEQLRHGPGLEAFDTDDIGVRAAFSWSYHALSPGAARLFRRLGSYPGDPVSLAGAASLAGVAPDTARRLLAELTNAHLTAEPTPGRYTLHDLLRAYARELIHEHDNQTDRQPALHRVVDDLTQSAYRTDRVTPGASRHRVSIHSPLADVTSVQLCERGAEVRCRRQ